MIQSGEILAGGILASGKDPQERYSVWMLPLLMKVNSESYTPICKHLASAVQKMSFIQQVFTSAET